MHPRPPTPPLDGYDIEDQVGFLLRRAHQRHAALFGAAFPDLTPTQFNALVRTVEQGAVTQNQLGRLCAMDPATVQGVVRRLVERGLVSRSADPDDRRALILSATEAGRALAAASLGSGHAVSAATLAPLNAAERATFLILLRKVS